MAVFSPVRVIVSLCKSGSSALIHSLAQAEGVTGWFQTVKSGQRMHGRPDYGVYRQTQSGTIVSKETIGPNTLEDCTLRVFPDDATLVATRPVFLVRDPLDTWAAWSRAGWGSLDRFLTAFDHLLALHGRARTLGTGTVFRYEAFGDDAGKAFRELCRQLGIGYTDEMIDWRMRFPDRSRVIWREDVQADIENGLSDSVRRASGFSYRRSSHRLPRAERDFILNRIGERYRALVSG